MLTLFWNIARQFMDQVTQDKFCTIYSQDKDVIRNEILRYLPKDKFPEEYGGTLANDYEVLDKFTYAYLC